MTLIKKCKNECVNDTLCTKLMMFSADAILDSCLTFNELIAQMVD